MVTPCLPPFSLVCRALSLDGDSSEMLHFVRYTKMLIPNDMDMHVDMDLYGMLRRPHTSSDTL